PEKLVDEIISELMRTSRLPAGVDRKALRKQQLLLIRRKQAIIPPGGKRQWRLPLDHIRHESAVTRAQLSFYAYTSQQRRVQLHWKLYDETGLILWQYRCTWWPGRTLKFDIPARLLSQRKVIFVELRPQNNPELFVPPRKGFKLILFDKPWWYNLPSLVFACLCHFSLVIALGMVCGTFMTMSMALFTRLVLYLTTWLDPIFQQALSEIREGAQGWIYDLGRISLDVGLFLFSRLEFPPIIARVAAGKLCVLSFSPLSTLIILIAAGVLFFTRKELDRLH
ncbi:MAG: hypothetical protein D6820_07575, partial [Lentisphaerae bacterium]